MSTEFNTQIGNGEYHLQFETDNKAHYLLIQEMARRCVDGNPIAMELKDTISAMCSEDYKARFVAEYYQTKIRYQKLHKMCIKYEAGTLDFEPACHLGLLKEQKAAMGHYLGCLEVRAEIEGIKL
mgnify:CR=1 FL=1